MHIYIHIYREREWGGEEGREGERASARRRAPSRPRSLARSLSLPPPLSFVCVCVCVRVCACVNLRFGVPCESRVAPVNLERKHRHTGLRINPTERTIYQEIYVYIFGVPCETCVARVDFERKQRHTDTDTDS